jgi:hypothetical protein
MSINKIEVVDFLINVLKEHEDILGSLIDKVEKILIENQEKNDTSINKSFETHIVKLVVHEWSELIKHIYQPEFACFDYSENFFQVTAKKDNIICTYCVHTSKERNFILKNVNYNYKNAIISDDKDNIQNKIDHENIKSWLSKQLKIDKKSIVFGKIELTHAKH